MKKKMAATKNVSWTAENTPFIATNTTYSHYWLQNQRKWHFFASAYGVLTMEIAVDPNIVHRLAIRCKIWAGPTQAIPGVEKKTKLPFESNSAGKSGIIPLLHFQKLISRWNFVQEGCGVITVLSDHDYHTYYVPKRHFWRVTVGYGRNCIQQNFLKHCK